VPNYGDPLEMIASGLPVHAGANTYDAVRMPTITNQPADLDFLFSSSDRALEIDYSDPNGEAPALGFWPCDRVTKRCFPPCVWMSRAQRDQLTQGILRIQAGIRSVVDFKTDFFTHSCNHLLPVGPTVAGPELMRCPTGSHRCLNRSCIPNAVTCTIDAGTSGCGANEHVCGPLGACVASSKPCCTYDSLDLGCCPYGPYKPPCAAPVIAGPAVGVKVSPSLAATGGGGGSGGGGGGGGGGDCPGGHIGSLRYCVQNGINGPCDCNTTSTSMCITSTFWTQNGFSGPLPAMCAAQGASCVASDGRTINAYCCPGLSCNGGGGNACGAGTFTCQKI